MKIKYPVLLLAVAFICSCSETAQETKEIIRPVKAIQVNSMASLLSKKFPAKSKEASEAKLAFRVGGPLIQFKATEGKIFRKGDLIAQIDPRDFKVDAEAKEARYIQAKAELDRYKALYAKNSISKNEYDLKLAAFKEAQSAYNDAINALTDTKLLAPYDAVVNKKYTENYEVVQADQAVVSIIDESVTEVIFTVPESFAPYIDRIEGFAVEFDSYPGKTFNAKFKEIVPKADGAGGFPVFLYLDYDMNRDKDYPIGYGFTCNVTVKLSSAGEANDNRNEFLVPVHAVVEGPTDSQPSVMLFSEADSCVHKQFVELNGFGPNGTYRVKSGLNDGDWLVIYGASQLQDGQRTRLLEINPTMTNF